MSEPRIENYNRVIVFVRHGESESNLGLASDNPQDIPITQKGKAQALSLAHSWVNEPDLIVMSKFIRTQQTASPTISRFPGVRSAIWPIHEFTYLSPSDWRGTTPSHRQNAVMDYWARNDPNYKDGRGAESFNNLMNRVEDTLNLLVKERNNAFTLLFSHEQFIKAVIWRICSSHKNNIKKFKNFHDQFRISNCEYIIMKFTGDGKIIILGEETEAFAA